uniref:Rps13 n=1 Tax=Blastocystis sp. DMP/10-212 TaxID=1118960 RepID=G9IJM7_9STRA|nr:rps13 [Blastocystis sp. DMP/10-212]APC25049.1 ribosomal protein S13 [Blastocystis sp. subtype 4]
MYINNNIFNFKNKSLLFILNKIYGINTMQAKYILKLLGYNPSIKIKDLTPTHLKQFNLILTKYYLINNDLHYQFENNKKQKILLNTYHGLRLKTKLPSHGQNTHSNAHTAKKLNKCRLLKNFTFI